MNNEKEALNRDNRRYFALRTVLNGCKKIASGDKLIGFVLAEALVFAILSLVYCLEPVVLRAFSRTVLTVAFIVTQPLILYACGSVPGSWGMYRDFVRIGLVNAAGEAPILLQISHTEDEITELHFHSKGVTLLKWQDEIEAIQSALDMTVVSIEAGQDHRTIIVMAVPVSDVFSRTIAFDEKYVDHKHPTRFSLGLDAGGQRVEYDLNSLPMGLIAGSTGSGKTCLAKVILLSAALRGYVVYVLDFKGLDFCCLCERFGITLQTDMQEVLHTLEQVESMIRERREAFQLFGAKDLRDYVEKSGDLNMKRILIYVDECAMLTDYGISKEAKKLSTDVIDKLSGIARGGRAFGVHLLIATQRPDANAVPGSIKSNLDLRICGKADATLSTIVLGDGRANERIPKSSVGLFLLSDGVQDKLFKAFYLNECEYDEEDGI